MNRYEFGSGLNSAAGSGPGSAVRSSQANILSRKSSQCKNESIMGSKNSLAPSNSMTPKLHYSIESLRGCESAGGISRSKNGFSKIPASLMVTQEPKEEESYIGQKMKNTGNVFKRLQSGNLSSSRTVSKDPKTTDSFPYTKNKRSSHSKPKKNSIQKRPGSAGHGNKSIVSKSGRSTSNPNPAKTMASRRKKKLAKIFQKEKKIDSMFEKEAKTNSGTSDTQMHNKHTHAT
jgi:hypothetical protein